MPLFMDVHIMSDISIDDVKKAHLADLEVQEKYNVEYRQFWINQEAGTLFCLVEGPDIESCEAVHQEAHGNIACNIVKVEHGFYNLFMGEKHRLDDYGMVKKDDGGIDLGYRFVLVVDIRGNTDVTSSADYKHLKLPRAPKEVVLDLISEYCGNKIAVDVTDNITAVFKECAHAVSCAIEIKCKLEDKIRDSESSEWDIQYKMGISGGQPLTEEEGFFERVLNIGQRLVLIAGNKEIIASNLVEKMNRHENTDKSVRFINNSEEQFLYNLFDTVEDNLSNNRFSVKKLSRHVGVSRSQLYRKLLSVTGRSPNSFIRDIRMERALNLLREKQYNISEVSLEVGFNSPSYFSKCFQDTYGIPPSKVNF